MRKNPDDSPLGCKVFELLEMILRSIQSLFGIVLLLVTLVSGCHTPLAMKQLQAKNPLAKNTAKTPIKVVDMWNSYAQTTTEGKVMRGMAGRVHFYDNPKENQAVKVDGTLTVYVFDGNESDPAHAKPLKVFQFKPDDLKEHYAFQKPLGHSYNFFLPIDAIGGEEKPLCIITRFDDGLKEDTFVMAPLVNTILTGRRPAPAADPTIREFLESRSLLAEANQSLTARSDSAVQQVGYVTEKNTLPQEKNRVTTIPLNSDMTRRLLEVKSLTDPVAKEQESASPINIVREKPKK